jgi:hypothetical protein
MVRLGVASKTLKVGVGKLREIEVNWCLAVVKEDRACKMRETLRARKEEDTLLRDYTKKKRASTDMWPSCTWRFDEEEMFL